VNATLAADENPRVSGAARAVLAAARIPAPGELWGFLAEADKRGYFTPSEDEQIRSCYATYLATRASLIDVVAALEPECGNVADDWRRRRPAFAVTLAAAALLAQGSRRALSLGKQSRLLRKKLDEPDPHRGVPAKTFARLYRAATTPHRLAKLYEALVWFRQNRRAFDSIAEFPEFQAILALLDSDPAADLSPRLLLRDRLRYRWFSFRRRNYSAWKKSVFELFRFSGSMIADLRQPGAKPEAAKRVTRELRESLLEWARPGDVFITRHDDALSNLFLPGFWPHAALFLGSEAQRRENGIPCPRVADPICFLEAKKDGVLLRPALDTLAVDALVVLRPPMGTSEIAKALERALSHTGKLYDFVFDFRTSDRLACTEVVYRAYHDCGALRFQLKEVGGRLCLPAEELINQALDQGFEVVLACGIGSGGLLRGRRAELAMHSSRAGI
jgi:hypothetical protein